MDNFERRLAASMKIAAEQRPNVGPASIAHRSNKRAGFVALAAAVVVGTLIAGTTWLFNPTNSSNPIAGQGEPCKSLSYEGQRYVRMQYDLSTGIGPLLGTGQTNGCGESEQIQVYEFRQAAGTGRPLPTAEVANWIVVKQESDEQSKFWAYESSSNSSINLEGEWVLTALTDADGNALLTDALAGKVTISFESDEVTGFNGCNYISGTYKQASDRDVRFGAITTTQQACIDPNKEALESLPLGQRLSDVRHISEDNGKLQLHAENWMIVAVLERSDAPFTTPEFPCSESDRQPTDLDVPGPGQPTPEEAVEPFANGKQLLRDPSNPNIVYAVNGNGTAYRVFRVTKQSDGWWPDSYTECRQGAATTSGDPDPAIWELAPGQNLTADSTEFDVLVERATCNSGVTGEVSEPMIDFADHRITVTFTVPDSPGGRCPSNDQVPVTVRLSEPIGNRALVDGQCSNTNLATTAFCKPSQGVRWAVQ